MVIDLTYSSCRMASNRLTRGQVESIYPKGKIRESFEPLDTRFIRKLHELLMAGTMDAYRQRVRPVSSAPRSPKTGIAP